MSGSSRGARVETPRRNIEANFSSWSSDFQLRYPSSCLKEETCCLSYLEGEKSASCYLSSSSTSSTSFSSDKVKAWVNQLVPPIICEEEEEEEMTFNLRPGFRERQCKPLSKSIVIDPSSLKKASPALNPDFLSKLTPSTPTTAVTSSLDEKPFSIGNISYHKMRKPFVVSGNISEDSFECSNSFPFHPKLTYALSLEEVSKFLSCIPSFIEKEPLVQDTRVLFPTT
ncbi:hypothetical protein PVL29_006546 [Vitis rotundifolia]|uniref:Uncharacterized protein n=1 Tax=Vitis rotundifolia TaxID=103349 RepID=A0AA39DY73_VITRO|nr:hypothetical protein PVL29_006546 [Vitis rotundifolia]